ncbi:MAG: hypothetical protein JOZ63_04160 [Planctomycetaceae bacterium]|nr:hypothetical protein [Planctomycetaceae bacterium]
MAWIYLAPDLSQGTGWIMMQEQSRPTASDAETFAEIAAICARVCGLDVRLTPLAEVSLTVGQSAPPPGTSPGSPDAFYQITCTGVRFDDEYVVVRLPTGGFRAFKVDADGRVVLRLGVQGGFRAHVSRVFGALIWDRLKSGREQFEPRLKRLPTRAAPPLLGDAARDAAAGLGPTCGTAPDSSPRPAAATLESGSPTDPPPVSAPFPGPPAPSTVPPPVSASPPGPPASPAVPPPVSTASPGPPASPTEPPPASTSPPGPPAPPPESGPPLARRIRGHRSKPA